MPPVVTDRIAYRLKDVADATKLAPDGQTIEGRMQQLCTGVAGDIKKCANICDTYLKLAIIRSVLFILTLLLGRGRQTCRVRRDFREAAE